MGGIVKVKKQQIVGHKRLIDGETGEIVDTVIIEKNVTRDFNFHKVWLQDILNVLDAFGNKKIKVLTYLLKKMRTEDNTVTVTYTEISERIRVSKPTISATVKELIEANVIKKIAPATYRFNPDVIVKGGSAKRQNLLIKYNFVDEGREDEIDVIEDVKQDLEEIAKKLEHKTKD